MKKKGKSKNKSRDRDTALIPLSPPATSSLAVDGTSHVQISFMANKKYSQEIVDETAKVYDLNKLKGLKSQDEKKFLAEGKKQVIALWKGIQHLTVHTEMFTVTFHIALGNVLNEVESYFGKKSKYVRWLKETFGSEHLRYFQHAKQLAGMGDFAREHSSLGTNRLLEFDHFRKLTKKSFEQILSEHPFPDTAQDMGGSLTTEHIDSIVTYHRLKEAGVDVDFDQATLMASYNHGSVEVRTVKKIKERLAKEKNKKEALEIFVMNKMAFPGERKLITGTKGSLNKILADLVAYCEKVDINNNEWVKEQKELLRSEIFIQAFKLMGILKSKLDVKIPAGKGSSK